MAETVADILADAGIPLHGLNLQAGARSRTMCWRCGGGKSREKSLVITVDDDGCGVAWHCHRASCPGLTGGGKITRGDRDRAPRPAAQPRPAQQVKPAKQWTSADQARPPALYEFFAKRGIAAETVDAFGCFVATVWFPELEAKRPGIAFPYVHGGQVIGHKYRAARADGTKTMAQDPGTQATLFNIDALQSDDIAYWVEGETDTMAMWEAGYRQVVSLRDGAPQELREEDDPRRLEDKKFAGMQPHAERLKAIKRWVIATDADAPGQVLREELGRRLGKQRCWVVDWPEGCKDAGDVLMKHGPDRLREIVEAAKPWPQAGLIRPAPGMLLAHRKKGRLVRGQEAHIEAFDATFKMPVEGGRLIVITGPPNMGKTTFLRAWLAQLAYHHGRKVLWASPEDGSVDVICEQLAQVYIGAPFWPGRTECATEGQLRAAEQWIADHFRFVATDDPERESTIEWTLEIAETAVAQDGVSLLALDPFNEFSHQRKRDETESEYIGRTLKHLKAWGRRHGVDIVIVAHPAKPPMDTKNKTVAMPDGYSISGSAHWFNKADLGLTVWLPTGATVTQVYVWKSRYAAWGKRGSQALLEFDPITGRFRSAGYGIIDRLPTMQVEQTSSWTNYIPPNEEADRGF